MELTPNNIIILILSFVIITYAYNDYIKPMIINIINGKSIKNAITDAFADAFAEGFTSQYSSLTPALSNKVDFDSNYYLRDKNKPIIVKNTISLPVINYSYYTNGSYEYLVGNYFKRAIYPIKQTKCITNIEAIYKFINNEIDIAFISEELLSRYIKQDCKYLTRLLAKTFNITPDRLEDKVTQSNLYPPINFSAIGVGFDRDFYLIVNNLSNIVEFIDIKKSKIGILADSYYYYVKMCAAYGIDITGELYKNTHIIVPELDILLTSFNENKYNGIFVVLHPKNKLLLEMTKTMLVRYIHIQKKPTLDSRNNLSNLINFKENNQQGTTTEDNIQSPPTLNQQAIYSETLMNDLKTVSVRENFNSLIKKYFQHITPRAVDLNKFHKNENKYSYLDTYSTRMILVIRNDIPKERVEYITENYITNLEKMRNTIDMEEFTIKLNNFSSLEFTYQELVSFDNEIPIADGARTIYKKEGLIYTEEDSRCKV